MQDAASISKGVQTSEPYKKHRKKKQKSNSAIKIPSISINESKGVSHQNEQALKISDRKIKRKNSRSRIKPHQSEEPPKWTDGTETLPLVQKSESRPSNVVIVDIAQRQSPMENENLVQPKWSDNGIIEKQMDKRKSSSIRVERKKSIIEKGDLVQTEPLAGDDGGTHQTERDKRISRPSNFVVIQDPERRKSLLAKGELVPLKPPTNYRENQSFVNHLLTRSSKSRGGDKRKYKSVNQSTQVMTILI